MAKILMIGEHASVRELIAEELAGAGYIVVAIGNPSLIGQLLTTLQPDLVLLDFHTNGINRWALLQEIKRQAPHLPVLTFAAYGSHREDVRLIIGNGFGIKSFSLDIFKEKIADLLSPTPIHGVDGVREGLSLRPGRGIKFSRTEGTREFYEL